MDQFLFVRPIRWGVGDLDGGDPIRKVGRHGLRKRLGIAPSLSYRVAERNKRQYHKSVIPAASSGGIERGPRRQEGGALRMESRPLSIGPSDGGERVGILSGARAATRRISKR